MSCFNDLRQQIDQRRRRGYYAMMIGENADEAATAMLEKLIDVCETEDFLHKGILDTVAEIQERNEGMKEMEMDLNEIQIVFDEMAVMVKNQGEQIDDIENQVKRFKAFVEGGIEEILERKYRKKNYRKCTCYVIVFLLLLLIILILVLL